MIWTHTSILRIEKVNKCLSGEMLLGKISRCFLGIVERSAFPELKVKNLGTDAIVWILDSSLQRTVREKIFGQGAVCAGKCSLAEISQYFLGTLQIGRRCLDMDP